MQDLLIYVEQQITYLDSTPQKIPIPISLNGVIVEELVLFELVTRWKIASGPTYPNTIPITYMIEQTPDDRVEIPISTPSGTKKDLNLVFSEMYLNEGHFVDVRHFPSQVPEFIILDNWLDAYHLQQRYVKKVVEAGKDLEMQVYVPPQSADTEGELRVTYLARMKVFC
jgi:hypothetical protein